MNLLSLERRFRSRDSLFKSSSFWTLESQVLELMPSPPTRWELLRRQMWPDVHDEGSLTCQGYNMLVNYITIYYCITLHDLLLVRSLLTLLT